MNAEQLLKHFDRMSDAPDAIPRLRQFILELAVRGKLVEQDVRDEPAAELLKRIRAEMRRLLKVGSLRKESDFDEITLSVAPFHCPDQWGWVRLGESLRMVNGRAFKPSDWQKEGVPIVRIQNLNRANAPYNYCDPEALEERHTINNGTFLTVQRWIAECR
jgi:type I restriction enzyme, S subunit